MDPFCYFLLVFLMLSCLFIAVFRSPAVEGLTSWLSCMRCFYCFVTFSCGVLGPVWYLIVLIPDLCLRNSLPLLLLVNLACFLQSSDFFSK